MYELNLAQIEEDGTVFPASRNEVIGVEDLLAEPKCNNFGDGTLEFSTFSQHNCFNFEEFSTLDYGFVPTSTDTLASNLNQFKEVKEFPDGVLGGSVMTVLDGKDNVSDFYEDYLLDTEFVVEASDLNPITGSYGGNLALESKTTVSGGNVCGSEISELSTYNIPVPEATCMNLSSLDKMTVGELHEAFNNMFGRETTVTDKQWLMHCLSFGLPNPVPSKKNDGQMISQTSDQFSRRVSIKTDPFAAVFNFKRKPRVQHLKRTSHADPVPVKASSPGVRNPAAFGNFGVSEKVEKESASVTRKRSRKPTQKYIDESLEQNSRRQKSRCGISYTCSKDKILHKRSYKQHYHEGFEAKSFVCRKEPFKGACIQVPFGQPVHKGPSKKKVLKSKVGEDSRLLALNRDTDMESFSTGSQDGSSEEDLITESKSRRKHNNYWSLSEVLKLVEGVSMCGVGRWTEIKKLLFHSSVNRTSVDLKDKWRNLVRASCSQSQSNREVESRRKHAMLSVPQSVLHRVRELAAIHPYPRERKTQGLKTISDGSLVPARTCDNLVSRSTAIRV